jgi:LysR family glycine cleavage system transcriptional activator
VWLSVDDRGMTSAVPPLLGLHAFEAAARHGSFVAAGEELHLSPSAISQRVRALEQHLGFDLFERLPRSVRLTELGRAYLPSVREAFNDLAAATVGLFGSPARTQLTLRVQISYAVTWLVPRLHAFRESYGHVDLRVLSAIWTDTLPPDEVDLEIRQGAGAWPGFHSTKLHDDVAVALCGPRLLERHGPFRGLEDLRSLPRVQVLGFDDVVQRFLADDPAATQAMVVDTSIAAIEIVAGSDYWTIVPERFARPAVRTGRVVLALETAVPMRQAHYLLHRADSSRLSAEAAAFAGWLRAQDALEPPLAHEAATARGGGTPGAGP